MRKNQLHISLAEFRSGKERRDDGIDGTRLVVCYSDSNNVFQAIGQAFTALGMRCFGLDGAPDPMGCRCDVSSTDDKDVAHRAHAKSCLALAKRRLPDEFARLSRSGMCRVGINLERFNDAVPDGYPGKRQVISFEVLGEDVFTGLAAAHATLLNELRRYVKLDVEVKMDDTSDTRTKNDVREGRNERK